MKNLKLEKDNKFLGLYYDLIFKKFLGSSEYIYLTTYLLETLLELPRGSLDGSEITNSVTLDKETIKNKAFELDVNLKTPKGEIFDIEIQNTYNKNAEVKNTMYICKLFSQELNSGDTYDLVKPVTLINLVKDLQLHNTGDILNKYVMTNIKHNNDRILEDYLTIYIIDIDSKDEINYNISEEFDVIRRFISAESYEELKEIVDESNNDLLTDKLLEEMVSFMNNEYVQDYSRQEMYIRSEFKTVREEGRAEGLAEGKAEGRNERQIEIAKMFLQNTETPIEQISLCTGLSLEELKKLQKEDR